MTVPAKEPIRLSRFASSEKVQEKGATNKMMKLLPRLEPHFHRHRENLIEMGPVDQLVEA